MSISTVIGSARKHLEEAQAWALVSESKQIVSIPSRDKEQPPTEVESKLVARSLLRQAQRAIDEALRGLQ